MREMCPIPQYLVHNRYFPTSFNFRLFRDERQCEYDVILRRVQKTVVTWKSDKCYTFLCVCARACVCGWTDADVCLHACSLTNPACNAPPYCHLRPLWRHHVFRHYFLNGTIFAEKLWNVKCVL